MSPVRVGRRARPLAVAAAIALAAVALAACGTRPRPAPPPRPSSSSPSPSPSPSTSPRPLPRVWLVTAQALQGIDSHGGLAGTLRRGRVLEIQGPGGGWFALSGALDVRSFRSLGALQGWLDSGNLGAVKAVIYDPEHWSFTPAAEQRDPAGSARAFVKAARAHALVPILAPGLDLAEVLSPRAGSTAGGYLSARLPAEMAQALLGGTGYIDIQAQSLERSTSAYSALIETALTQIHTVDPAATVLAGLSTNPPGGAVGADQLLAAVNSTASLVAGYWLNVPGRGASCPSCGPPDPGLASQLLERLA